MPIRVASWATAIPPRVLTNPELNQRLALPAGWIENRTGISTRHIAGCHESTATLATNAARDALDRAQLDPDKIDLLIAATTTPEQPIPSTAAFVAGALDLHCGAMDINTACTGFVAAFLTATAILNASAARHALVIGAETYSRIVNPNDRPTAVVFGDAAAAVLLETTPTSDSGLLSWDLGCDPTGRDLVELIAGGSRQPTTADSLRADQTAYVCRDVKSSSSPSQHLSDQSVAPLDAPASISTRSPSSSHIKPTRESWSRSPTNSD